MEKTAKEMLSEHVENIFKGYTEPGLYISNIATGGGKSYTIGKLTCEYYPQYFERIVILCVQKKLVLGMQKEIERFIESPDSKITEADIMIVDNSLDVIKNAVDNGTYKDFISELNEGVRKLTGLPDLVRVLQSCIKSIDAKFKSICRMFEIVDEKSISEDEDIRKLDSELRGYVHSFFMNYKKYIEKTQVNHIDIDFICKQFPSLEKAYPQVLIKKKKVLLMTVHKAMHGIDPILEDRIKLTDLNSRKKTLFLFDESDQAAVSMRDVIIEQSIQASGGINRNTRGYDEYLQYYKLLENKDQITKEYSGDLLENGLTKALIVNDRNWKKIFKDTKRYNNILLGKDESIENFRRGVFFSGPTFKLNIKVQGERSNSYICYKKGEQQLRLVHLTPDQVEIQKKKYDCFVSLDSFLSLTTRSVTAVKTQFRHVVTEQLKVSKEQYEEDLAKKGSNTSEKKYYLGYPTKEREVHTLFSRFSVAKPVEDSLKAQLLDFITNRKNIAIKYGDKTLKIPDYSVYAQGFQLYQEELDESDNLHRVRLSCREITTTPEKIIYELANSDKTSVVLCSATASGKSVVNNLDTAYLQYRLGEKYRVLTNEQQSLFDQYLDSTLPENHKIDVVKVQKYEYQDKRENKLMLPEKYKLLFSEEAQEQGLDEKWFRHTVRNLKNVCTGENSFRDMEYQLNRLFQFIEVYHYFYTHDDIHSMIYFQNQSGDKNKKQIHVLASLIDGSFKKFGTENLEEWENEHIRTSKDWETVEKDILGELGRDKKAKIMLVTAYNSFKAGANMQYTIPKGLKGIVHGDNWEKEGEAKLKDWDAIYLQLPTNYLTMNDDGLESSLEKSLYRTMLVLMMLHERGCISKTNVQTYIGMAMANKLFFKDTTGGVYKDKSAWVVTIVEQAVGRLCRTRNKPNTTHILYDESMAPFFCEADLDKSMTKEFRTLCHSILKEIKSDEDKADARNSEMSILLNNEERSTRLLKSALNIALRYNIHAYDDDNENLDDEQDDDNGVNFRVKANQMMLQSFKTTILKKPVIRNIEELDEEDKLLSFIDCCYGEWERTEEGGSVFYYNPNKKKLTLPQIQGSSPKTITPAKTRLETLMKNPEIKKHFELNGFATDWKKEGLILNPKILTSFYIGELGEEAFKAIVHAYINPDVELKHLTDRDYELADFVIDDHEGKHLVAFDVKNMNPKSELYDREGDMDTTTKRQEKEKRLGCSVITVNILEIKTTLIDETQEIGGLISEEGKIVPKSIETLERIINSALENV